MAEQRPKIPALAGEMAAEFAGTMIIILFGVGVVAIGFAWGTDAGYAINPARDFGPRLAEFFTGYGSAWRDQNGDLYFWVPIVGPLIGGVIGAGLYKVLVQRFLPADEPEPVMRSEPEYEAA